MVIIKRETVDIAITIDRYSERALLSVLFHLKWQSNGEREMVNNRSENKN